MKTKKISLTIKKDDVTMNINVIADVDIGKYTDTISIKSPRLWEFLAPLMNGGAKLESIFFYEEETK